jgi:hypothetical protein
MRASAIVETKTGSRPPSAGPFWLACMALLVTRTIEDLRLVDKAIDDSAPPATPRSQ